MHELSIAREIISIIESEKESQKFEKVNIVRLRAGAMSCVDPGSLSFVFEAVREGTCAAGAILEVETEPMKLRCRQCENIMPGKHGPATCHECGSTDMELNADTTVEITSLEVD